MMDKKAEDLYPNVKKLLMETEPGEEFNIERLNASEHLQALGLAESHSECCPGGGFYQGYILSKLGRKMKAELEGKPLEQTRKPKQEEVADEDAKRKAIRDSMGEGATLLPLSSAELILKGRLYYVEVGKAVGFNIPVKALHLIRGPFGMLVVVTLDNGSVHIIEEKFTRHFSLHGVEDWRVAPRR